MTEKVLSHTLGSCSTLMGTHIIGINLYAHVLFNEINIKYKLSFGEMVEWLTTSVLKINIVRKKELLRVQIPLSSFSANIFVYFPSFY